MKFFYFQVPSKSLNSTHYLTPSYTLTIFQYTYTYYSIRKWRWNFTRVVSVCVEKKGASELRREITANRETQSDEIDSMKPEEASENAIASSLEFVKNLLTQAGIDVNSTDGMESTSDGEKPETILDMFIRQSMEVEVEQEQQEVQEEVDDFQVAQEALKLFAKPEKQPPTKKPPKEEDYFASNLEKIAANVNAAIAKIRDDNLKQTLPENDITRDVDRLLEAANKVYGFRVWSAAEKKEFEKFCKILRFRGTLSNEEKEELKMFYAKAYKLTDIEGTYGERRNAVLKCNDEASTSSTSPKLELEPLELFGNMLKNQLCPSKKRGRPPKTDPADLSPLFSTISDQRQKEKNILRILSKANDLNGQKGKIWSPAEIKEFEKFYEIFIGKQSFSVEQSKELNEFYKRAYGEFDPFLIAKEVDERQQEKKKYWQEYRRNYYLARKAQGIVPSARKSQPKQQQQVVPKVKQVKEKAASTAEEIAETRKRKAAYLREWRTRKANEKKIMSMLVEAAENGQNCE
ncbi:unnamed protein product [Caenorhabditis angaria]|uniref:Uncharacterized protein n=1 Tax=Caenorhabditis angaria TaxID=860376 RepID=A0A9P1IA25_9PELO|nr:unnamed protein product [Caenorhabditis angaria]